MAKNSSALSLVHNNRNHPLLDLSRRIRPRVFFVPSSLTASPTTRVRLRCCNWTKYNSYQSSLSLSISKKAPITKKVAKLSIKRSMHLLSLSATRRVWNRSGWPSTENYLCFITLSRDRLVQPRNWWSLCWFLALVINVEFQSYTNHYNLSDFLEPREPEWLFDVITHMHALSLPDVCAPGPINADPV